MKRDTQIVSTIARMKPTEQAMYVNSADVFHYTPAAVRLMGMWVCADCGGYNYEREYTCFTCGFDKHMLRLEQREMIEANNKVVQDIPVTEDVYEDAERVLFIRSDARTKEWDFIFTENDKHLLRPAEQQWHKRVARPIDVVIHLRSGIRRRFVYNGCHKVQHEGRSFYKIQLL